MWATAAATSSAKRKQIEFEKQHDQHGQAHLQQSARGAASIREGRPCARSTSADAASSPHADQQPEGEYDVAQQGPEQIVHRP